MLSIVLMDGRGKDDMPNVSGGCMTLFLALSCIAQAHVSVSLSLVDCTAWTWL